MKQEVACLVVTAVSTFEGAIFHTFYAYPTMPLHHLMNSHHNSYTQAG